MKKIYSIEINGIKFTMPNAVEVMGHDDSLPYNGTLHADGVAIADFYNDGWGGRSDYTIKDGMEKRFWEIEKMLKGYGVADEYGVLTLYIDFLADILASCQIYNEPFASSGDKIVKLVEVRCE